MDSNKDEGVKCLRIGKAAMEAGDKGRALKFLKMAQRLYPIAQVEDMLATLMETKRDEEETAAAAAAAAAKDSPCDKKQQQQQQRSNSGEQTHTTTTTKQHGSNSSSSSPSSFSSSFAAADVSAEQVEVVQRIRRTRDYYQILGLSKNCTDDEVRKAYRKLSLKVHPDKNQASGAEEAFKAVSKAFQVLSDAGLRERYDLHGPEEEQEESLRRVHRRHQRHTSHGAPVYYEDIFDPNDIFNAFFGMHQANGSFHRTHFVRTQVPQWNMGTTGARVETYSVNLLGLLQLLPVVILLIVALFPFSQPVYSLSSVAPYQIQQKTKQHEVRYYVKSQNFDKEYAPGTYARQQLEAQIEREFKDVLVQNCRMELGLRRWGQGLATPYCDRLERFQRV